MPARVRSVRQSLSNCANAETTTGLFEPHDVVRRPNALKSDEHGGRGDKAPNMGFNELGEV